MHGIEIAVKAQYHRLAVDDECVWRFFKASSAIGSAASSRFRSSITGARY
jgi:hypothetical protein